MIIKSLSNKKATGLWDHQVQMWLQNYKDPTMWGWKKNESILEPVIMSQAPAPAALLQLISCSRKKGCKNACTCWKVGTKRYP